MILQRSKQRILGGLYIGFLLHTGGCAWIPLGDKSAEFLKTSLIPHQQSETHTDVPIQLAQHWPHARWWLEFGSQKLNNLMATALRDNVDLKVASARLRQAQALVRVENAKLLPFLDAEVEFENTRISENGVYAALNRQEAAGANLVFSRINPLSFRYEFDFWGKNKASLDAAIGEATAEKAEYADAILKLTVAICRTYINGVALFQQLALAQEMAKLSDNLLILEDTRLHSGLDPADLVKQATIDLEQINKREASLRDQLDMQRNLLAQLTGKAPDATQNLFNDIQLKPEAIRVPTKLPLELLSQRPDLASSLLRATAAAQRIKVAKANFLPTIDLSAFVGVNALRMTKGASSLANLLFSGSSFSYGIAPGLRLPWFEGGRLRGELSAQRAEYDNAVELYNKTLLHAIQQVSDSLSRWQESASILKAQNRLLFAQHENLELAQQRYFSGLDDRRAVLKHQYTVLNQEFTFKILNADQLNALVDLVEAMGGGYVNDLQITQQPLEPKLISWLPW